MYIGTYGSCSARASAEAIMGVANAWSKGQEHKLVEVKWTRSIFDGQIS